MINLYDNSLNIIHFSPCTLTRNIAAIICNSSKTTKRKTVIQSVCVACKWACQRAWSCLYFATTDLNYVLVHINNHPYVQNAPVFASLILSTCLEIQFFVVILRQGDPVHEGINQDCIAIKITLGVSSPSKTSASASFYNKYTFYLYSWNNSCRCYLKVPNMFYDFYHRNSLKKQK